MRIRVSAVWLAILACLGLVSTADATIHNVDVGNFFFSPTTTIVDVGDTVRWTFISGFHSSTSDPGSPKQWDSGVLTSGTFSITITAGDGPGPFPYHCSVHPGMTAVIEVTAASDSDGDGVPDVSDNCPSIANPSQTDGDGDTYGAACDCDDTQASIHPGAEEIPNDGIDQDCNGSDLVSSCCSVRVGDINGEGVYPDEVTLGDIMLLVDVKFVSADCSKLPCVAEADVNQDGGANPNCDDNVTLGDIMAMVDFLFITGPENGSLATCI